MSGILGDLNASSPFTPTATTDSARTALSDLNATKRAAGSQPYAGTEAQMGLRAASTNAPATPPRDIGFIENLSNDARALVTGLPKLPALIPQELGSIFNMAVGRDTTQINNPFDLARLPGFRMIPGAFLAGQFGTGPESHGWSGLYEHPLFTGLDVLPYASKAAKLTNTFKAAEDVARANAEITGVAPHLKPISTVVRNWSPGEVRFEPFTDPWRRSPVSDVELANGDVFWNPQQLAPNVVGRAVNRASTWAAETRPGQFVRAGWGEAAKGGAQASNRVLYDTIYGPMQKAQKALAEGVDIPAEVPAPIAEYARAQHLSGEANLTAAEARTIHNTILNSTDRASTLTELGNLDPRFRAYAEGITDISDRLLAEKVDRGLLKPVDYTDTATGRTWTEHLPTTDADKILSRRAATDLARDRATRAALVANPALAAPHVPHMLSELRRILDGDLPGTATAADRTVTARATISILGQLGYEVGDLWKQVTRASGSKGKLAAIQVPKNLTQRVGARALEDLAATLKGSRDPLAQHLAAKIRQAEWGDAAEVVNQLNRRTTHGFDLDINAIRDDLAIRKKAASLHGHLTSTAPIGGHGLKIARAPWTEQTVERAAKVAAATESRLTPGRFARAIRTDAESRFTADLSAALTGDQSAISRLSTRGLNRTLTRAETEAVGNVLADGVLSDLNKIEPNMVPVFERYFKDSRNGWQKLAASDVDPFYVHTVTPSQARAMRDATLLDHAPGISSVKDKGRTLEQQVAVPNLAVSVAHEAHELFMHDAAVEYLNFIGDRFTTRTADALAMFEDRARAISTRTGRPYREVLTDLTSRHFVPYEPGSFVPNKGLSLVWGDKPSELVIPRELAASFNKLVQPTGPVAQFFGKPMNVFRTAVLPLSPRWHCVPTTTEVLTREGWTTHDKLTPTTEILTFNMETNECEWQVPIEVTVFDFDGELLSTNEFLATEDHRWPSLSQMDGAAQRMNWTIRRGYELRKTHRFLRAALDYEPEHSILSARDAAILGWIVTDGSFHLTPEGWPQARIYQSPKKYLDEIVRLLGDEGGKVTYDYRNYDNTELRDEPACAAIVVKASCLRRLMAAGYHEKADLASIITRLDRPAMRAMWTAMLHAEGSRQAESWIWSQVKGPVNDAFQILCFLLGHKIDAGGSNSAIVSNTGPESAKRKNGKTYQVRRIERIPYRGQVWCPTTPNGTWVMRQDGRAVVTGNTNNIVSGAFLTAITMPSAFRFSREAWQMAREGALSEVPGAPAAGTIARQAWGADALAGIDRAPLSARLETVRSYQAGSVAGRAMNSVANALGDRGITWIGKVTDAAGNVVEHSYNFNQLFDDFYRSLAYLGGKNKAERLGLSAAEAERAGVKLSREVLQNWDRLTPIERGIVKNVFPFASWAEHVIRFALRYPAEHPLRLAVGARLAEHEYNDHLSGVPERLRDLLFFGDVNDGQVTGINVAAANPFRDLANYPALLGFLTGQKGGNLSAVTGQINPIIGSVMESIGVDPAFGADLYPELEYDPSTGGLRVAGKSFPMTFATNLLPQLNTLSAVVGWNDDYKRLLRSNPDAAARHLQSSMGLPILAKTYNMDAEQIKAEIVRYRQMNDEKAAAVKAGDLGALNRWPTLREQVARGQLKVNEQSTNGPGIVDLLPAFVPGRTVNR